jgi:hypothetical protein
MANTAEIEFCHGNSLICFSLKEIVKDGESLCTAFGFKVQETQCFSGTPSAISKGAIKHQKSKNNWLLFFSYFLLIASSLFAFWYIKRGISKHTFDIREARLKALDPNLK